VKRILRAWLIGGLGLALAAAASAQVRVLPAEALAPIGVAPLLVGTPAAPAPALAAALSFQVQAVAALPVPAASAFLVERAASAEPAERAAAKLVAASLVPPVKSAPVAAAPAAASDSGLRELAESARADPSLAAWFDESKAAPSLELDGLTLKRGTWRRGETKLERLGQGEFGFVDVHPTMPGAVIKTVAHSAEIQLFSNESPRDTAAQEEATARTLTAADAGPRHFGQVIHDGYLISVRERVSGDTLEKLSASRKLGPAERELVQDLMRRLAAAGLKPDDLRPSNIMIGRTALDPRRRAYVVDGGRFKTVPAGLDSEGRYNDLMSTPVVLRGRMDPNIGWVEFSKPMTQILDEGVERFTRKTRWQRFKGFWKDFPRMLVP
jgi:hypothetical protein